MKRNAKELKIYSGIWKKKKQEHEMFIFQKYN